MNFEQPPTSNQKDKKEKGFEEKEKKEVMPEVFQEIKDDIKAGRCIYNIMTKIIKGSSFRGYEERDYIPGYRHYAVGSEIALEKMRGIIRQGSDVNFMFSEKYGNAAILAAPLTVSEVSIEKEKRKFFGTKKVKVRKERNAIVKDLGAEGGEELYRLKLSYPSSTEPTGRTGVTVITFCLRKSLAEKLLDEAEKRPETFWEFIDFMEPSLRKITGPTTVRGTGLAILKEDWERKYYGKPEITVDKLLPWQQKFRKENS